MQLIVRPRLSRSLQPRMNRRDAAIALGVGAATAAGLSLLKVDKPLVIGSTAVVVGAGLLVTSRNKDTFSAKEYKIKGDSKKDKGDSEGMQWIDSQVFYLYRFKGITFKFQGIDQVCGADCSSIL